MILQVSRFYFVQAHGDVFGPFCDLETASALRVLPCPGCARPIQDGGYCNYRCEAMDKGITREDG